MELFILEYYEMYQFEFFGKIDEIYLEGNYVWNEDAKKNLKKIYEFEENQEEQGILWYLDPEGYRLDDKELFKKSPWSIIKDGEKKKVIQRYLSENGEATFALDSWIGLIDEFSVK